MDDDDCRLSTAIHEAGHLVAAYRLGLYCGDVTIEPNDGRLGSSTSEQEQADGSTDRDQIVTLFAGLAAQQYLDPNTDLSGSRSDEERARELLQFQPSGAEEELRSETARLVADNWTQIEAVAEELLWNGTLDGDEATFIVDAIDEEVDWREELVDYRRRRPPTRGSDGRTARPAVAD